jgi:hypothetical protein
MRRNTRCDRRGVERRRVCAPCSYRTSIDDAAPCGPGHNQPLSRGRLRLVEQFYDAMDKGVRLIRLSTRQAQSKRQWFAPQVEGLVSIKCNPDPARLSPDDVTLVIAVLRVDN